MGKILDGCTITRTEAKKSEAEDAAWLMVMQLLPYEKKATLTECILENNGRDFVWAFRFKFEEK